jgi:dihydropteroate synthase
MQFAFLNQTVHFTSGRCLLFGILNLTPDSFSDGGCFSSVEKALAHAVQLYKDGADVIDIGGESTRPGASSIPAKEELARILPTLRLLKKEIPLPISIDTSKSEVAQAAISEGASIVNDISGLADPQMAPLVARTGAGLILMHSRGTPQTMQTLTQYSNVIEEVKKELKQRFERAVADGVRSESISLDPGIGFAKSREQNLTLLANLHRFCEEEPFEKRPLFIGVSRKSFLGGDVSLRAAGSLAAEILAYQHGARMIRTHDVAAIRQALNTLQNIQSHSQHITHSVHTKDV